MSFMNSNYYDCNENDELGLEPRLMEYIKKKQFFKKNNIEIEFLDKEFSISKTDIAKIKAYMKSDKKNYTDFHSDIVDMSNATFPSSEFQKDKRLERIKAKQKKETEANEQRHDYGIISKSYDMYRNDRPFASASGNDFTKSKFHPNEWFANSRDEIEQNNNQMDEQINFMENYNKKRFSESNTYVNPKSLYNGYVDTNTTINQNNHTIDEIIGKLDTYSKSNQQNQQNQLNKQNQQNNYNYFSKRETENNYKAMPFMSNNSNFINQSCNNDNNNNIRDMDVDSHMRFGETPLRAGKSLGYPSAMEHAFSYISSDIQDPNHVVMDRGIPSRAFNKETIKSQTYRTPMR